MPAPGPSRAAVVLAAAAIALGGCGSEDPPEAPDACAAPPAAYLTALRDVPEEGLIGGTTPIGSCLVEEQSPGRLAGVGASIIAAATELNREIRRAQAADRSAASARARRLTVQLGYLVGAVQEAASGTGGIHADLVRRLDAAARYLPGEGDTFSAGFERAFGQGYAAGQASV
jgi:hypothetical protein